MEILQKKWIPITKSIWDNATNLYKYCLIFKTIPFCKLLQVIYKVNLPQGGSLWGNIFMAIDRMMLAFFKKLKADQ